MSDEPTEPIGEQLPPTKPLPAAATERLDSQPDAASGAPISGPPAQSAPTPGRRSPAPIIVLAALLVIVLAGVGLLIGQRMSRGTVSTPVTSSSPTLAPGTITATKSPPSRTPTPVRSATGRPTATPTAPATPTTPTAEPTTAPTEEPTQQPTQQPTPAATGPEPTATP